MRLIYMFVSIRVYECGNKRNIHCKIILISLLCRPSLIKETIYRIRMIHAKPVVNHFFFDFGWTHRPTWFVIDLLEIYAVDHYRSVELCFYSLTYKLDEIVSYHQKKWIVSHWYIATKINERKLSFTGREKSRAILYTIAEIKWICTWKWNLVWSILSWCFECGQFKWCCTSI